MPNKDYKITKQQCEPYGPFFCLLRCQRTPLFTQTYRDMLIFHSYLRATPSVYGVCISCSLRHPEISPRFSCLSRVPSQSRQSVLGSTLFSRRRSFHRALPAAFCTLRDNDIIGHNAFLNSVPGWYEDDMKGLSYICFAPNTLRNNDFLFLKDNIPS